MYNPPDHIQQQTLYNPSTPTYTSWSGMPTMQAQSPTTIMTSALNCWSLTSSPPPPHQISSQPTPSQSPSHQIYQPSPISNITNLSYPSYYSQDLSCTQYQNPEYVSVVNSDISYAQIGSDRNTPIVYHNDVGNIDKVNEYDNQPTQSHNESPESTPSTPRTEWVQIN